MATSFYKCSLFIKHTCTYTVYTPHLPPVPYTVYMKSSNNTLTVTSKIWSINHGDCKTAIFWYILIYWSKYPFSDQKLVGPDFSFIGIRGCTYVKSSAIDDGKICNGKRKKCMLFGQPLLKTIITLRTLQLFLFLGKRVT